MTELVFSEIDNLVHDGHFYSRFLPKNIGDIDTFGDMWSPHCGQNKVLRFKINKRVGARNYVIIRTVFEFHWEF